MEKLAITGSTGGIGFEVVKKLVFKYDLILINRNIQKANKEKDDLLKINPNANITLLTCDMENIFSVRELTNELIKLEIDYLIINAGILTKEKHTTNFNYDNVFTTNFLSPYYIINRLKENDLPKKRVIAVGSVSQKWAKLDKDNIDYNNYKSKNKRYANSKRFLMSSLMELYKDSDKLSIAHPGITLTNMTKNYNKFIKIFIIIFMSILFQGKKKASRSIVKAIDINTNYLEWIGPHILGVYGKPKVCKIKLLKADEIKDIYEIANNLYKEIKALD